MADFVDRIRLIVETVTDNANTGLKSVKADVEGAEGAFGKLKAGAGGAMDFLRSNSALAAGGVAAVGTAVTAFVRGAIGDYEDLALAAEDFATKAGTSVEDASRLIEVSNDLGVGTDAVAAAMQRLNREASTGKLAAYGVDAGNASDRLVETLQHIARIPDETQRAQEMFAIFGKSGGALAPLLANVDTLATRLKGVNAGQVMSDADVTKAREYADAVDGLSDAWKAFKLEVGSFAIGPVTDIVSLVQELGDAIGKVGTTAGGKGGIDWGEVFGVAKLGDVTGGLKQAADGSLSLVDNMKGIGKATIGLIPGLGGWADENLTVKSAQEQMSDATAAATDAANAQAQQVAETAKAISDLTAAVLASFNSQLAYEDAQNKTTDAITKYVDASVDASVEGGTNAAAVDKMARSLNDAEQAALAQAAANAKVAEDAYKATGATDAFTGANDVMRATLLDIAEKLGPNDPLRARLFDYIAQLGQVPADINTDVTADTSQAEKAIKDLGSTIRSFVLPKNVVLPAPNLNLVPAGAAAPEGAAGVDVFAAAAGGPGLPSAGPAGAHPGAQSVTYITNHWPPGARPADVVAASNTWNRVRGTASTVGATGL